MTRATEKPVKRIVKSTNRRDHRITEFTVEIRRDDLTMRPIRTKSGGPAEVVIPWSAVYDHYVLVKFAAASAASLKPPTRRKRVLRGAL